MGIQEDMDRQARVVSTIVAYIVLCVAAFLGTAILVSWGVAFIVLAALCVVAIFILWEEKPEKPNPKPGGA